MRTYSPLDLIQLHPQARCLQAVPHLPPLACLCHTTTQNSEQVHTAWHKRQSCVRLNKHQPAAWAAASVKRALAMAQSSTTCLPATTYMTSRTLDAKSVV